MAMMGECVWSKCKQLQNRERGVESIVDVLRLVFFVLLFQYHSFQTSFMGHSVIHLENLYSAPQETYSEALPVQPRDQF